jgi:putative cofactor-binding repeat protein
VLGVIAVPLMAPSIDNDDGAVPKGFVSVRKFGAKGDGITDDTEALTWAHASGEAVYYPKTASFYRISSVLMLSAPAMSNGATIRIIGDGSGTKTIFRVSANTHPITISGFLLDGGYRGGTKSEFSHGINLRGARDVTITGNTIRNLYGDCVCIDAAAISSNIRIHNNKLINPRRCNVAVVCGQDVAIENNLCVKQVDYVAGIDLEPDTNGFDFVRRVRIVGNNFSAAGTFLLAGVNNGTNNTDLLVSGNHGHAAKFLRAYQNALLRDVKMVRNRFSATSPEGLMFDLQGVYGGEVSDNFDETACGAAHRSTRLRDCELSLLRNTFCS